MNEKSNSKSKVSEEIKIHDYKENHDSSRVGFLDNNQDSFVINRSQSPRSERKSEMNLKRTVSQNYEDRSKGSKGTPNKRDSQVKSNRTQTIDNTEDIGIASGGLTSGQRFGDQILDK